MDKRYIGSYQNTDIAQIATYTIYRDVERALYEAGYFGRLNFSLDSEREKNILLLSIHSENPEIIDFFVNFIEKYRFNKETVDQAVSRIRSATYIKFKIKDYQKLLEDLNSVKITEYQKLKKAPEKNTENSHNLESTTLNQITEEVQFYSYVDSDFASTMIYWYYMPAFLSLVANQLQNRYPETASYVSADTIVLRTNEEKDWSHEMDEIYQNLPKQVFVERILEQYQRNPQDFYDFHIAKFLENGAPRLLTVNQLNDLMTKENLLKILNLVKIEIDNE